MERLVELLRSAEMQLSAAQEALDEIQSCADEASGLFGQCALLVSKKKEFDEQLFRRKADLVTGIALVLQSIKPRYELQVPGMKITMTDGPLKVQLPYVRTAPGARPFDTLPTINDEWEGLTRYMDRKQVFWDFCQVALAAITSYLESVASDTSRAQVTENLDKIMGQFHDLKTLVEA